MTPDRVAYSRHRGWKAALAPFVFLFASFLLSPARVGAQQPPVEVRLAATGDGCFTNPGTLPDGCRGAGG